MLTVSRKTRESVHIFTPSGETIVVYVDLSGGRQQAKLSFDCDRAVRVVRTELLPEEERCEINGNR